MYGPFQSQSLELLELELRWESTDVVETAQVLVFSRAQLVGSVCAVLACAHLARAAIQAALRRGLRATGHVPGRTSAMPRAGPRRAPAGHRQLI
jgi:hypothetical protein